MAAYAKDRDRSAGNRCDIALVLRARDGDIAAFESLYRKYHNLFLSWARRWLKYDEWVAEFADEAIAELVKALPQYRPERAAFCSWAYRVARSSAIKHMQVLGTDRADAPVDEMQEDALPALTGPTDDFVYCRLREELAGLDPEQRAAVDGTFNEGLSDRELASEMRIPRRRVCYRRQQGLAALRRRLSDVPFTSIRPETRFSRYYYTMTDVKENEPALLGERG